MIPDPVIWRRKKRSTLLSWQLKKMMRFPFMHIKYWLIFVLVIRLRKVIPEEGSFTTGKKGYPGMISGGSRSGTGNGMSIHMSGAGTVALKD